MNASDRIGSRLAAAWVRCYTAGLADDVRSARRNEVASDIWEHAEHDRLLGIEPRRTSTAILARTVRGVLDDMAWRRDTCRHASAERYLVDGHRRLLEPVTGASRRVRIVSTGVILLAGSFIALCAAIVAANDWDGGSDLGRGVYAGVLALLGVTVLAGTLTWQRRLKLGLVLTIAPILAFSALLQWSNLAQLAALAVPFALVGAPWERRIDTGWSAPRALAAQRSRTNPEPIGAPPATERR